MMYVPVALQNLIIVRLFDVKKAFKTKLSQQQRGKLTQIILTVSTMLMLADHIKVIEIKSAQLSSSKLDLMSG